MFNHKQQEIERLTKRIAELEEIICPHNIHDWELIEKEYDADLIWNICKCRKCHRILRTLFPVDKN